MPCSKRSGQACESITAGLVPAAGLSSATLVGDPRIKPTEVVELEAVPLAIALARHRASRRIAALPRPDARCNASSAHGNARAPRWNSEVLSREAGHALIVFLARPEFAPGRRTRRGLIPDIAFGRDALSQRQLRCRVAIRQIRQQRLGQLCGPRRRQPAGKHRNAGGSESARGNQENTHGWGIHSALPGSGATHSRFQRREETGNCRERGYEITATKEKPRALGGSARGGVRNQSGEGPVPRDHTQGRVLDRVARSGD